MAGSSGVSSPMLRCFGLAFASLVSMAGCGGQTQESPVGSSNAEVVFTKTITLSAPKGMSVFTPVLNGSNSLVLGAFSNVLPTNPVVSMGSTGSRAEPDAYMNDLWSRGTATLRDRVHLRGSLYAATRSIGNNVVIDGTWNKTPVFDPPSTLTWTVTFPSTTPTDVVLNSAEKNVNVAPGRYGLLRAGQDSVMNLRAGTYYINDLQFDTGATIQLDQTSGPIILYVSNTIILRSNIVAIDGTPPDLLIGFLGTNSVFVEVKFNGAVISPFSTIYLRDRPPQHTGFFAGKSVELDAQADVGYRIPLAIIPAAAPPEATCRSLVPLRADLSGAAQQEQYVKDLARYCGICRLQDDSDGDGTSDCLDGCPFDAGKTTPGSCGCGVSEVNLDNDPFPGCIDRCDSDSNNLTLGDCGCVGTETLAPAGTPCGDPACPGQTSATCNSAGVCGNRNACRPSTECQPIIVGANVYWLCGKGSPTPPTKTWPNASTACSSKGLVLARIDTYEQNKLLRNTLNALGLGPTWIGANSRTAANVWRWARAGSDNGDQFWQGGPTGTVVLGRFNSWGSGEPGTARCTALRPSDGRWIDNDCSQALPYVCELPPTPKTKIPPRPPIPKNPQPAGPCVPENGGSYPLPPEGDLATLQYDYEQAGLDNFQGTAANPPAVGHTCPRDLDTEACPLTNVDDTVDCAADADCVAALGAGYVCRNIKLDENCFGTETAPCASKVRCGIPSCEVDPFANRCEQIEVCGTDYTSTFDGSASDIDTPSPVDPTTFFAQPPDTTPSPTYSDPPVPGGRNHSWCRLYQQDTDKVEPANNDLTKHGESGSSSPIKVSFDPQLIFQADPAALPFGETDLLLRAKAGITAHVKLTGFLGQNYDQDILRAGIGIQAQRCRLSTAETELMVAGIDILDLAGYIPKLDTDDPSAGAAYELGKSCKDSLGGFLNTADRLKKAFRDAQTLLKQYNAIKSGNLKFPADFCNQIGILDIVSEGFPLAGICPEGELPEITINRFVDYYQSSEFGEVLGIKDAIASLGEVTTNLREAIADGLNSVTSGTHIDAPFVDFKRSESQTILNTQFFIGPVPMKLEIAVVAGYGIYGGYTMDLQLPSNLLQTRGDLSNPASPVVDDIAKVSAVVEPWASAGLTLFVGAGFSVPGVSASIGIEGGLTLARIGAPIHAGVGLALATTPDSRPIPSEIQAVSDLINGQPSFPFGLPQAYQFFLSYDYGAQVNLTDVLSGTVNGRLRIKFFFFSRTWRKKIVQFTGWSLQFPLISGSGNVQLFSVRNGSNAPKASGNAGMGRSEPQLPFTFLSRLFVPEQSGSPDDHDESGGEGGTGGGGGGGGTGGTGGVATVDKSEVESFGYDDLCCSAQGQDCSETGRPSPPCCPGLSCESGFCAPEPPPECADGGETCGYDDDLGVVITCCSGDPCPKNGICPDVPTECTYSGYSCGSELPPCCPGLLCGSYGFCYNPDPGPGPG
jgi:hypothetical protein